MRLKSEQKKLLNYLSQLANEGIGPVQIEAIAKHLDTEKEKVKAICHPLHTDELIESYSDRFFSITAVGREELKPWWKRHFVAIVAVLTLIVAILTLVVTLSQGHDSNDRQDTMEKNQSHKAIEPEE